MFSKSRIVGMLCKYVAGFNFSYFISTELILIFWMFLKISLNFGNNHPIFMLSLIENLIKNYNLIVKLPCSIFC